MSEALEEMVASRDSHLPRAELQMSASMAILVATGNQALMTLSASICAAIHWTTYFKYRSHEPPRDAIPSQETLRRHRRQRCRSRSPGCKGPDPPALADTRARRYLAIKKQARNVKAERWMRGPGASCRISLTGHR